MSISDFFGFELEINFLKLFQNIVFKFCPFLSSLLKNKLERLSLCAESQMHAAVQLHSHTATQINNKKIMSFPLPFFHILNLISRYIIYEVLK